MQELKIKLENETGLHARPASLFVQKTSKYSSDIKIIKGEEEYNGKSIMSVLSMGAAKGEEITILADGEDEKEALEGLKVLIESNFNE